MERQFNKNVSWSLVQAIASSIILFLLFRILVVNIGMENVGVWSMLAIATSLSKIADLGLSSAITRYIVIYLNENQEKAANIFSGILLILSFVAGLILTIIYYLLTYVLDKLISNNEYIILINLLPYALICTWVSTIGTVVQSALDGANLIKQRAGLLIFSQGCLLVLVILFSKEYSIKGVIFSQAIQNLVIVFFGLAILRQKLPSISLFPKNIHLRDLKICLSYSAKSQGGIISLMIFEPIIKVLLAKYGGMLQVGQFEIAGQVIYKVRSLIVSACQPMILEASNRNSLINYNNVITIIYLIIIPVFSLLYIFAVPISYFISGSIEKNIIYYIRILSIAWAINALAIPSYFINIGDGNVKYNSYSHLLILILGCIFSLILGPIFHGNGVVISYSLAIVFGSIYLIYGQFKRHNINIKFNNDKNKYILIAILISMFSFNDNIYCYFTISFISSLIIFLININNIINIYKKFGNNKFYDNNF